MEMMGKINIKPYPYGTRIMNNCHVADGIGTTFKINDSLLVLLSAGGARTDKSNENSGIDWNT
jgi:hypothetical protein